MKKKTTLTDAKKAARAIGWTLRHVDGEFQAFPIGTDTDHPAAIFETDAESALATIRYATASNAEIAHTLHEMSHAASYLTAATAGARANPLDRGLVNGIAAQAAHLARTARELATTLYDLEQKTAGNRDK